MIFLLELSRFQYRVFKNNDFDEFTEYSELFLWNLFIQNFFLIDKIFNRIDQVQYQNDRKLKSLTLYYSKLFEI